MKRTHEGMGYRTIQFRNSRKFKSYTKKQQKQLRELGYHNVGWEAVIKSYNILSKYVPSQGSANNIVSFRVPLDAYMKAREPMNGTERVNYLAEWHKKYSVTRTLGHRLERAKNILAKFKEDNYETL